MEHQVNGIRVSPDHVNEVRQQFLNQVNSIAGKPQTKSDDSSKSSDAMSVSSDDGGSSDGSKSPDQSPAKSHDKKSLQSNRSHQNKGKNTSSFNQGKSKQGSSNHGVKNFKGGDQFYWGKGSGPNHSKFNQAQKVH